LFVGDDVFKPVRVLSGGERSRLALARTLLSPANVLVLDEPTNPLDIYSKDVLAEALRQYTGAFVLVSHDRHFIDAVAESVWYVEDRAVKAYTGTYTEAQWQRENGTAARLGAAAPASGDGAASKKMSVPTTGAEAARPSGGKKTKEEKRREAEARNAAYQTAQGKAPAAAAPNAKKAGAPAPSGLDARAAAKALQKVEAQIAAAEARKTAIEAEMAAPDLYSRPAEFAATMARFNAADEEVKGLYARWEALAAQAEA
ncbi:MAG TPA: ATP-binding cassette domain-containing protein, partial [Rubricoccaceae bacterium]